MKQNAQASGTAKATIVVIAAAAILLVLGTWWTGQSARSATEDAVRSVSMLYLDELAGRREQVVASNLQDSINTIETAVGFMTEDDLSDLEHLQAFQSRMKALYGLDKFAFVDDEGSIYTSLGMQYNIDEYGFDYTSITEPEISVKDLQESQKEVVIAVPLSSVVFQGHPLVVCFMEIDMQHLIEGLSLQSDTDETTFCNIYSTDGTSLTNMVLGGLASENNLLEAMSHAQFEPGYSLDAFLADFAGGKAGMTSFTYNGIPETLAYEPVHGTDWMLTYLIRESVIAEQTSSVYDGIVMRNIAQMLVTILVLMAVFGIMITQTRRSASLALEKEAIEVESRVKQEEMEQRIALQNQLLEQEGQRARQQSMITALASDYRGVYYIDLDADEGICYQSDPTFEEAPTEGARFPYRNSFEEYARNHVAESYRDGFLEFIDPANIRERLEEEPVIGYRYLMVQDGRESYEMLRMAGVRHAADRDDHTVHAVGAGFSDVDKETRETMAQSQALSDALAVAEEASKAKTAFLSSMSHEIRTPMNAIIGLDSIALSDPDISDRTRDQLEKIGESARHLLGLINDILDVSRIESGKMSMKNENFSFSQLLEQVNTIIGGQCDDKGLNYRCTIRGRVSDSYVGDGTKLRQTLINILGNAVKFTPAGGNVELTVEQIAQFEGRSTLRFTMSDTGIGIDEEFLPHIFDKFSQEDASATNKYGSTGLGMAITKSIVEMMNGSIDVESQKGVGTTFTVTVTLVDSDVSADECGDGALSPSHLAVLVVDDDPVACEHAELVLREVGVNVQVALSGAEAVEMVKVRHARRDPFDLILVDWKMPEMDGVETTRQIRAIAGSESAIVILTAYNWDDVLEEALAAGVDSFIAKPLFAQSVIDEFTVVFKKKNETTNVGAKKADLTGRKILLAEDMPINAEILKELMSMREVEVDHAENGRIAVEMFEASEEGYYDAVLMDMRMPEMDGLAATEAIRALDRHDAKMVPIIALTANAFDEDVQQSLQAGLNAHLSKPIEPDILFDTLESLIS